MSHVSSVAQFQNDAVTIRRDHLSPPRNGLRLREVRALPLVMGRLLCHSVEVSGIAGADRPVMLLPGFGTGHWAMESFRKTLDRHGFYGVHWGLGVNSGDLGLLLPLVEERVRQLAEQCGTSVTLLGWSLGGYIARELARDLPDLVDQVVTLGSPAWGGPKYTSVASLYRFQGVNLDDIADRTLARFEKPITQPIRAYYSENDGVVNWECCVDHWSPNFVLQEIDCPHMGMPFSTAIQRDVLLNLNPMQ